jgi:hypothetical protein
MPRPRRWLQAIGRLLIAIPLLVAPASTAPESPIGDEGITRFLQAVDDYVQMHRRLERQLPPLEVNANPETIRRAVDAMAAAVRAERRDAARGDLFNPAARAAIRSRIADALSWNGLTADDVLEAERAAGVDPRTVLLHVNGAFPWAIGSAMFPCVTTALPPLPPELQYRVVGRDLVLIDLHANLIVDILPFALTDGDGVPTDTPGSRSAAPPLRH